MHSFAARKPVQLQGSSSAGSVDVMKECGQGVQNRYFIWRFCTSTRKALNIERFRPVDHELVRFMIRNIFEEIQAPVRSLW